MRDAFRCLWMEKGDVGWGGGEIFVDGEGGCGRVAVLWRGWGGCGLRDKGSLAILLWEGHYGRHFVGVGIVCASRRCTRLTVTDIHHKLGPCPDAHLAPLIARSGRDTLLHQERRRVRHQNRLERIARGVGSTV